MSDRRASRPAWPQRHCDERSRHEPTLWTWARLAGGAAILAVLVWRLGAGPFLDASAGSTTPVRSLRRRRGHGGDDGRAAPGGGAWSPAASASTLPLRAAVAAYYRSQFLNATLPGGVLGDVHRAVAPRPRRRRRSAASVRAVGWERVAGQVVQVVLTVVVLLAAAVAGALVDRRLSRPSVVAVGAGRSLLVGFVLARHRGLAAGSVRAVVADVRDGAARAAAVARRSCSPPRSPSPATSLVFLVAARTAGVAPRRWASCCRSPCSCCSRRRCRSTSPAGGRARASPPGRSAPPAWARRRASTVAVVYGVMVLVATLPGAVVLLAGWLAGAGGPASARRACAAPEGSAMADRPYTLLSCGMSIDGYLDNASEQRLLLSNDADLDRVDAVRAGCDAILVGAATVRNDNPRLLVRDRRARRTRGSPAGCRRRRSR